ncbi:MAG: hypothetical protein EA397_08580 [Deltaproteobacteria bacterium]|nr:MAG: hypothetical protein EA397_08580 [Deltaproteobacteria bacterium]
MARALIALITLTSVACSESLDGFEWDVTLTAIEDGCNPEPIGYQETLRYRIVFEGANARLHIGPNGFANGSLSGCSISYSSVTWGEEREDYTYRWVLSGQAAYRQSSGCDAQLPGPNIDWSGTETFTIVDTDDPDIPPGCEYVMEAEGVYLGPSAP